MRLRFYRQISARGLWITMQFQKLSFKNPDGKLLAARLDLPLDEKPAAFALFAHCFTCTKNFNAVVNINRALVMHGIAVMRFDFTGLGESEGDFSGKQFFDQCCRPRSGSRFSHKSLRGAQASHRSFAWRGRSDSGSSKDYFRRSGVNHCRTHRTRGSVSFH